MADTSRFGSSGGRSQSRLCDLLADVFVNENDVNGTMQVNEQDLSQLGANNRNAFLVMYNTVQVQGDQVVLADTNAQQSDSAIPGSFHD